MPEILLSGQTYNSFLNMLNSRSQPRKDGSEPKPKKSRKALIEHDQPKASTKLAK
jgi:hypothetical protein